jgi:prepilin-type N-terminal cleavage/methylation domain-containing protein
MGRHRQRGFSFIETLVVIAVFTLITGITFRLLDTSQQRYRMESQVLDSFQGAQIAMDQMTRDIHTAGYPPMNSFASAAIANANPQNVASTPFAWSPSYPVTPCTVGACTTPGSFDLIVETDVDPQNNNGVEWVRYRLNGTTLERGWAKKTAGADPDTATAANMIIYVENVMNNASSAQRAAIQASYPSMFPGNAPVPIFSYSYDAGKPSQPPNIREINITLIVQAQNLDPKTRQPRVITLTGRARRVDPNQ